jgi:surface antigen
VAIAASAIMLSPGAATAQINPFRTYRGPVLPKDDLAAGREAAARLLAKPDPTVGMSESWTGPHSGNAGTMTVERVYKQHGNDCRAVRSTVHYKQGNERSFVLSTCHVSGQWRLMS